jgi:hypothetical protein
MQDNMPSCTLLGGFSRELHSADYSWGISIKLVLGYINQVTTSLLHQLGGYPKEVASKVHYARQSKVDF